MKEQAIQIFDRYVRARYPILALVSHEESRVQREILNWAGEKNYHLYTWTITAGLRYQPARADAKPPYKFEQDATADPAAALREVSENFPLESERTLFLFKDLHRYMQDPVVVRFLRDLVVRFEATKHTPILLAPVFQVPQDLEKSVSIIDWPLPDVDVLEKILRRAEIGLPDSIPVTLNGSRREVIQALRGLSEVEAETALLSGVIATGELGEGVVPHIVHEKKQIIRKSGVLEFFEETATMADVGGLSRLKSYAETKLATFSDKAAEFGVRPAKGVVLLGIPGTGKSLAAKAFAGGRLPLLRLDFGAVMGSLVGESEANIRQALKTAEAVAPAVLWIDEIEKALGGAGSEHDGGTSARVFGTVLTWMQEKQAPVYVIATANDIRNLKGELIRRFDDVLFVDLPGQIDREEVLKIHLEKRKQTPCLFGIPEVARATRGFTGAEIEKVVANALEVAFLEDRAMTTHDLLSAAKAVVPISETMKEQISDLRNWAAHRAIPAAEAIEEKAAPEQGRMLSL